MEIITKCPQCHQVINTSNSRLVKELCGHIKCRNCILNDTEACSTCLNVQISQDEPVTLLLSPSTHCKVKTEWAKLASESLHREESTDEIVNDDDNEFSDQPDIETDSEMKKGKPAEGSKIKIIENIVITPERTSSPEIKENKKKIRLKDKKKKPKNLRQHFSLPSYISTKFVNNVKIFECEICQRTFKSTTNIKYHLFCDKKQQKPYSCDICDKRFVTSFHLNYHKKTHLNEELFQCTECDSKYLREISLKNHMKKHTHEWNFICEECGDKFQSLSNLKLHENKHKNFLPFKCNKCDKGFALKCNLMNHLKFTHSDKKNFKCDKCDKRFCRPNSLKQHLLSHSKQRPFKCSLCSKAFVEHRMFLRHKKIHSDEKEYDCPLCVTKCGRKDNFMRHLKNLHPEADGKEILQKISENVLINKKADVPPRIEVTIPSTSVIKFAPPKEPERIEKNEDSGKMEIENEPLLIYEVEDEIKLQKESQAIIVEPVQETELYLEIDPKSRKRSYSNLEIYRKILTPYSKSPQLIQEVDNSSMKANIGHEPSSSNQLEESPLKYVLKKSILNSEEEVVKNNKLMEIYRKILIPSNDEEILQSEEESHRKTEENNSAKSFKGNDIDFSEVHWRKRNSQYFNTNND